MDRVGKHEPIINALVRRAILQKSELLETIDVLLPSLGQRSRHHCTRSFSLRRCLCATARRRRASIENYVNHHNIQRRHASSDHHDDWRSWDMAKMDEATRKRARAGRLMLAGKTPAEAAQAVGVARQMACTWKAQLDEGGLDALR